MQTVNILVKISFQNQQRRFRLPKLSFADLEDKLVKLFHLSAESAKTITYLDDEYDWITVGSDVELAAALEFSQLQNCKSLLLKLITRDGGDEPSITTCSTLPDNDPKEMRLKVKEAKKTERMEKRELQLERKQRLRMERQRNKKEKLEAKLQKKEAQDLKKKEREELKKNDVELSKRDWPTNLKKVYLDGNSMLFISGILRKYAKRGPRSMAEKILIEASSAFHHLQTSVTLTHLVFDNSTNWMSEEDGQDRHFIVSSARPEKASTDDLFAEIAQKQHEIGQQDSCLFIASDRELGQRIRAHSCACMKPGRFWEYVFNFVNSDPEITNLDQWFEHFLLSAPSPEMIVE